ncbi:MAG: four helix bundle protein [Chloroflexota bacterium]|nr:four helix bundle protein [Chloroflexota bacterium]MBI5704295.1 four helix bundle protein [Chloroflexota bacterium]
MATFEDLQVLKSAEEIADSIWKKVIEWDEFARDVVGKQIARSADSIGANIAESVGRYNFGEKLQFLYYSRGSLFETKYWLNRTRVRGLMNAEDVQKYVNELTSLARQLNTFASGLKGVRTELSNKKPSAVREDSPAYIAVSAEEFSGVLFSEDDLNSLNS